MTIDYVLIPLSHWAQLISSEDISEDILLKGINNFEREKEKDLEDFIKSKACIKENRATSRTYLFLNKSLLEDGIIDIMAFISLATTSLSLASFSKKQRRKILGSAVENRDNLISCSVYLIGQLGRNDKHSKEILPGKVLLSEAISIFKNTQEHAATADIVILECRPYMFECFYKKHGFSVLQIDEVKDYDIFLRNIVMAKNFGSNIELERKKILGLEFFDIENIEETYGEAGVIVYEKYKDKLDIGNVNEPKL
ncbi:MAG: hypothetical protein ACRC6X_04985 [Culicoidibacterales bacterium]